MWVDFVVSSCRCVKGFLPGSPVFLPPQKLALLNSSSIRNPRVTDLSVARLLRVALVEWTSKVDCDQAELLISLKKDKRGEQRRKQWTWEHKKWKFCVLYFYSQESLAQRSSPLVYCLPFVRKFILIGMSLFGRSMTLKTCFPVHSLTGCNNNKQ